jgi:hypothetical protein
MAKTYEENQPTPPQSGRGPFRLFRAFRGFSSSLHLTFFDFFDFAVSPSSTPPSTLHLPMGPCAQKAG